MDGKVSGPNSVTNLKWTPLSDWCVVRCGSKNRQQKEIMGLQEIWLCVQNVLSILDSIVYKKLVCVCVGGGLYYVTKLWRHVTFRNSYQLLAGSKFFCNWTWLLHPHLQVSQNLEYTNWSSISSYWTCKRKPFQTCLPYVKLHWSGIHILPLKGIRKRIPGVSQLQSTEISQDVKYYVS